MAVKQKVVEGQRGATAAAVAPHSPEDYLQLIVRALRDAAAREPGDETRAEKCASVVLHLGAVYVPNDEPKAFMRFMADIKAVQEILSKECNNQDLVLVTLKELYDAISDPDKTLSPAMSIVLQLMDAEAIPYAVKYILSKGHPEVRLRKALHTLCTWLTRWTHTPNLGPLVLELVRGLENERRFDLLLDVTIDTIQPLFKLMIVLPAREGVAPVVLRMLAGAQHSAQVLEKIAPHVSKVVEFLSRERSPYLRPVVDACAAMGGERLRAALGPHLPSDAAPPPSAGPPWFRATATAAAAAAAARVPGRPVGIANLGNTCYMNAALQALFASRPFREEALRAAPGGGGPALAALQTVFALLQFGERAETAPADALAALRPAGFAPGRQHDSSEFLECLLDALDEQERGPPGAAAAAARAPTMVDRWFGGRVTTTSTCGSCGARSERADGFRSLQLSFPPAAGEGERDEGGGGGPSTVQDLLDYFERPERLCDDNRYRCDGCGRLGDGERAARVSDAPPRLILALKQFRYDPSLGGHSKLRRRVHVDTAVRVCGRRYHLYSAVVHCGASADAGHYYALARHGDAWFRLDDGAVAAAPPDAARRLAPPHAPYVLMYSGAADDDDGGGGGGEGGSADSLRLADLPPPPHLRELLRRRRNT